MGAGVDGSCLREFSVEGRPEISAWSECHAIKLLCVRWNGIPAHHTHLNSVRVLPYAPCQGRILQRSRRCSGAQLTLFGAEVFFYFFPPFFKTLHMHLTLKYGHTLFGCLFALRRP